MEEKLIELIENLNSINTNQNLKVRYDGHYQIDQPIISKTISLANECLINSQRQAIYSNISLIYSYGFPTYLYLGF